MPVAVVLAGLAVGAVGVLCTLLLHLVQHLLYGYHAGTFLLGVEATSPRRRVLALAAAGPVVGTAWWWHRRHVDGDSLSVTRALRDHSARLPLLHTLIDAALQVVAVGAGASMGREGAPRQAGAALGTWIGGRLGLLAAQRSTLLAAGAGAGLAVVYDVPVAGVCFTLELLLGSLAWRRVVPTVVVTGIATVVSWPVLTRQPSYVVHGTGFSWPVLAAAAPIGILAAAAGLGFSAIMRAAREHAPGGATVIGAVTVGFVFVGLLGARYPALLGNGKGLAQVAFAGTVSVGALAVMTVLKPVATAACLRAGAIGGLLTPALATGAAGGLLAGRGWDRVWPGGPGVDYALLGAAAMLAVTQRAAWTAMVLTVELTRADPGVVPALVLAVAVAVLTVRLGTGRPVRDATPTQHNGLHATGLDQAAGGGRSDHP